MKDKEIIWETDKALFESRYYHDLLRDDYYNSTNKAFIYWRKVLVRYARLIERFKTPNIENRNENSIR